MAPDITLDPKLDPGFLNEKADPETSVCVRDGVLVISPVGETARNIPRQSCRVQTCGSPCTTALTKWSSVGTEKNFLFLTYQG